MQSLLTQWRLEKGLTTDDVAKHLGVARETVRKYEAGVCRPKGTGVFWLARLLGKPFDEVNGYFREMQIQRKLQKPLCPLCGAQARVDGLCRTCFQRRGRRDRAEFLARLG